ncbi:LOW QUALITY PROTEIN: magnesium transporter MRS2-3 [Citrus clementina]|uniref:LOW QUALITY PROTEIN: magnesium transporter MRS2-3 n=1 Tax=Citrus clementina TaxID=85681 RepID=UPI000CED2D7E|nr:LOW QUALITY PROTEIN: magnesium transporter MRS2-3 [Citrus x clementina]
MRIHPPRSRPEHENNPDPTQQPTTNLAVTSVGGVRKKVAGVRPWLVLDSTGQTQVVEAGKHAIMRRTGLPARDLRILDPMLSYPSTILGRESAIVINLEQIKAIITAQEVLLLNSRDPSVAPFVEELKRRILCHYQATKAQEGDGDISNWKNLYDSGTPESRASSPPDFAGTGISESEEITEERKEDGKQGLENRDGPKVLPFEFVALEACLESACSCLENEATTLEQEAHPALDTLTSKISTLNLERVRQIKSRLVAISGRVQKVRDELEHLLDDDEDMAEMYLTEKLQQQLKSSSTSSMRERDDDMDVDDRTNEISFNATGGLTSYEVVQENTDNTRDTVYSHNVLSNDSHGTHTSTVHSTISNHLDVEELEMLLEAYFVQVDGIVNKLSTLREYVDDTEDYINIMLDDKQNNLLQMGVMMTTATLVISAFIALVGVFGMNITIELFDHTKARMPEFLWTVAGGTIGTIFLYAAAIAWYKYKRLLES